MALKLSTSFRNSLLGGCSMKQALEGGTFEIFGGSVPTDADAGESGTSLVEVSKGGSAFTPETQASATITLTGSAGTISVVTVDGYSVLHETVTFDTDLTTTASLLAAAINRGTAKSVIKVEATAALSVVTVKPVKGQGTALNAKALASTGAGGLTATSSGNLTGGVAAANGLTYGTVSDGTILKSSDDWKGTCAFGTTGDTKAATYFRIKDCLGACMIQGLCGSIAGDYIMGSTTMTSGANHTIDQWQFSLSATSA